MPVSHTWVIKMKSEWGPSTVFFFFKLQINVPDLKKRKKKKNPRFKKEPQNQN